MRGKIVCALFAVGCCAFGQGLLRCKESPSRPAVPEAARQACAKIPEEHRKAVESDIREMAHTEATREAGEKFGLLIVPKDWTNVCGKGVLLGSYMEYYKYAPDGRLVQYGNRTNFEELVWCDRRRDELVVQFWNDRAIVDAALSNAVASTERAVVNGTRLGGRPSFPLFNRPRRLTAQPQLGLLEELVPLEEAMALAKAGKGKGFYQLALRYARGEGLPQDDVAAYRMLCKARDADYAHAVLVEGLCDEKLLCTDRGYSGFSQKRVLRSYCGADFTDGRAWDDRDFLTNAVAVARVMGKYEKAKRLGALVATNQIAALNKRLSDFKAEEAKRLQAEENAKRVAGLLDEKNTRPKTDAREARERAAAERERAAAEREHAAAERERAAAEREQLLERLLEIQAEIRRQREQRKLERPLRDERMVLLPKYRAAFKALTGYEMGQKIDEEMLGREREWKRVKLAKPYRYFTDCTLEVCDGCLYGVSMSFGLDGKYSRKSLEAEAEAVRKDLAGRFGMEEEEILERTSPMLRRAGLRRAGWRLVASVGRGGGIWLSISDDVLARELRMRLEEKREAQREAQKEVLPVFEEAGKK